MSVLKKFYVVTIHRGRLFLSADGFETFGSGTRLMSEQEAETELARLDRPDAVSQIVRVEVVPRSGRAPVHHAA